MRLKAVENAGHLLLEFDMLVVEDHELFGCAVGAAYAAVEFELHLAKVSGETSDCGFGGEDLRVNHGRSSDEGVLGGGGAVRGGFVLCSGRALRGGVVLCRRGSVHVRLILSYKTCKCVCVCDG